MPLTNVDPHKALIVPEIVWEDYNVEEDLSGDNGPEAQARAELRTEGPLVEDHKEGLAMLNDMFGKVGLTARGGDFSFEGGDLYVPISSAEEIFAAEKIIFKNRGSYPDEIDIALYLVARTWILMPLGFDGPRFEFDEHDGWANWYESMRSENKEEDEDEEENLTRKDKLALIRVTLRHALISYDRKEQKKKHYNVNALGIYMGGLGRVMDMAEAGEPLRQSLVTVFTGRLLDVTLKAVGEPKSTQKKRWDTCGTADSWQQCLSGARVSRW